MKRIGLLSDTHSCWDERFAESFADCDEIWHAGDVGSMEVADKLAALHPLRCVCGNCDGGDLRIVYPPLARFRVEEVEVMMTHIGGYPGHYAPHIRERLMSRPTDLFVCGHSHILKVVRDPSLGLLHINPGAAGHQGWHLVRTLVRFSITGKRIHDLEVVELGGR